MTLHSPSDIEVMLDHYYSGTAHPRKDVPLIKSTIARYVARGLLEKAQENEYGKEYVATRKGRAWVEMICQTPYPEERFVNPLTNEILDETPLLGIL